MELKLEVCSCLCATSVFKINGIDADCDDFGEKYDHNPEEAEPYGCGNMQFDYKPPTIDILNKYNIIEPEYNEIVSKLSEKLSFESCGWCV